ncbi:beta-propeller domain-containing protein [Robertkochia flava]|uniref:hypothetical protein n=1 Tax=Robertkochia flava TaxID=3447986 RepID=UPI001CCC64F4|nr:hypothetical protein [Robertkochia marina]
MKNHCLLLLFMLLSGALLSQISRQCITETGERPLSSPGVVDLSRVPPLITDSENPTGKHQMVMPGEASHVTTAVMGRDGSYFYVKRSLLSNDTSVFYRAAYHSGEMVLFQLADYHSGEEALNVIGLYPDQNAGKVAIAVEIENSGICDVVVVDLNGHILDNYLTGISPYRLSWMPDGQNLLYHRWSADERDDPKFASRTKTMMHKVGTTEKEDRVYFSAKTNPELTIADSELPTAYFDSSLEAVVGIIRSEDQHLRMYLKLGDLYDTSSWMTLATARDQVIQFSASQRQVCYLTSEDAQNRKIMISELRWPDISNADLLVPEFPDELITSLVVNADGVYFTTEKKEVKEARLWFKALGKNHPEPIGLPHPVEDIKLELTDPAGSDIWVQVYGKNRFEMRYRYIRAQGKFVEQPVQPSEIEEANNEMLQ